MEEFPPECQLKAKEQKRYHDSDVEKLTRRFLFPLGLALSRDIITVKEALTEKEVDQVHRLNHDVYVNEGYAHPRHDGRLNLYPLYENLPETYVLIAKNKEGKIVGTNSITFDSEYLLPLDMDFPDEMKQIREQHSSKICAANWRLVTDPKCREKIMTIRRLFESTLDYAILFSEMIVCNVNPTHEKFYKRMFNFETVAKKDAISLVNDAPAVMIKVPTDVAYNTYYKKQGNK